MSLSPSDELQLINQILTGEHGAARKFYQQFYHDLKKFIFSRTKCPEDGQEIIQNTFLSAIESLALYSGRSKLNSWLYGIARHEISDYYRKKRVKTLIISHTPLLKEVLGDHQWQTQYDRLALREQISQVMNRLLPRYVQILRLKYLEGWSVSDISHHLNESFKATETALYRARNAFALEWNKLYVQK